MIKNKGFRAILIYMASGIALMVLGKSFEKLTGYNPQFGEIMTLENALFFLGFVWFAVAALFLLLFLISNRKPSEKEVEQYESSELRNQILITGGILTLFVCSSICALLPTDHKYYTWITWMAYAGLFVAGIFSIQPMRSVIFSLKEPRLADERIDHIYTGATATAFSWTFQLAAFGFVAHSLFSVELPIWYAFMGPVIFGHLGLNVTVLKQLWSDRIPNE